MARPRQHQDQDKPPIPQGAVDLGGAARQEVRITQGEALLLQGIETLMSGISLLITDVRAIGEHLGIDLPSTEAMQAASVVAEGVGGQPE
jgi:hypothetical protein